MAAGGFERRARSISDAFVEIYAIDSKTAVTIYSVPSEAPDDDAENARHISPAKPLKV